MSGPDTSRISPTAHYTGYVWVRNGLSHPAFETAEGRFLFRALQPFNTVGSWMTAGLTLERMLLQRHRIIDYLLDEAITNHGVTQIVEVAAGMSARGWRFSQKYEALGLTYVEGDLPGMARNKRNALDAAGIRRRGHHVLEINALADDGDAALGSATADVLDEDAPTAVITEGLLNYFDRPSVVGIWGRFQRFLERFPQGFYFSDISVTDETDAYATARVFKRALSVFARGDVHLHFANADAATEALRDTGFHNVELRLPREMSHLVDIPITGRPSTVRIIEARTVPHR